MKRRLAIIVVTLAALFLAACGPSAQEADETARQFCAHHGGVDHIEYYDAEPLYKASFDAECKDGSKID